MAEKAEKFEKGKTAKKTGIKNISLELKRSAFSALFHMFSKEGLFEDVAKVRALLSNERARIIHTIKESKPKSLYQLAKLLGRDFKSVRKDIQLLEHFEIIELVKTSHKNSKRQSLKPVLKLDTLQININL